MAMATHAGARPAPGPVPLQVLVSFHPEDQATATLLHAHLSGMRSARVTVGQLIAQPDDGYGWAMPAAPDGRTGWRLDSESDAQHWRNQIRLVVAMVSAPYLAAAISPPVYLLSTLAHLRAQRLQVLAVAARPCAAERVLGPVELLNDPERPLSRLRLPQREAFFVELVDVVAARLRTGTGVGHGAALSNRGEGEEVAGDA